jgi:hypothetical protein
MERKEAPLRVWKYRGWCAICRLCNPHKALLPGMAIAVEAPSWDVAFEMALWHLKGVHAPIGRVDG